MDATKVMPVFDIMPVDELQHARSLFTRVATRYQHSETATEMTIAIVAANEMADEITAKTPADKPAPEGDEITGPEPQE